MSFGLAIIRINLCPEEGHAERIVFVICPRHL